MRLWSLHPRYLDPQGLVALWREALLARAVLRGETKGYRSHPQLDRFRDQANPLSAMDAYLAGVYREAVARGYSFDPSKIDPAQTCVQLPVTDGQISYEWQHLLQKLAARNPVLFERWRNCDRPDCHPLFVVHPGPIAPWERPTGRAGTSGR
jgi:hypothetical protein